MNIDVRAAATIMSQLDRSGKDYADDEVMQIAITKKQAQAALNALKMQIPQRAYTDDGDTEFECPACGAGVEEYDVTTITWCPECGQRLKWED